MKSSMDITWNTVSREEKCIISQLNYIKKNVVLHKQNLKNNKSEWRRRFKM